MNSFQQNLVAAKSGSNLLLLRCGKRKHLTAAYCAAKPNVVEGKLVDPLIPELKSKLSSLRLEVVNQRQLLRTLDASVQTSISRAKYLAGTRPLAEWEAKAQRLNAVVTLFRGRMLVLAEWTLKASSRLGRGQQLIFQLSRMKLFRLPLNWRLWSRSLEICEMSYNGRWQEIHKVLRDNLGNRSRGMRSLVARLLVALSCVAIIVVLGGKLYKRLGHAELLPNPAGSGPLVSHRHWDDLPSSARSQYTVLLDVSASRPSAMIANGERFMDTIIDHMSYGDRLLILQMYEAGVNEAKGDLDLPLIKPSESLTLARLNHTPTIGENRTSGLLP